MIFLNKQKKKPFKIQRKRMPANTDRKIKGRREPVPVTMSETRRGLQKIRDEHSFQIGHTAAVVSAAAAAAQTSTGYAAEAAAMSAAAVQVVVRLVLVLVMVRLTVVLRHLAGGVRGRLRRDQRVDRQDGSETGLGPARRGRRGRQGRCGRGARLVPVVVLLLRVIRRRLVVPVVLRLRLVVLGASGRSPLVRYPTADGRSVGRRLLRDSFATTATRSVDGRGEIFEIVVGRRRGRAHAPGGQRGVPALLVAVVTVVRSPVASVVRRIVLVVVGRRVRRLFGPVRPSSCPVVVTAATTRPVVVVVVVLSVQLFAKLLQVLRQSVVRRRRRLSTAAADDHDGGNSRHDRRLVVQAVGRRRVVGRDFAVVHRGRGHGRRRGHHVGESQ